MTTSAETDSTGAAVARRALREGLVVFLVLLAARTAWLMRPDSSGQSLIIDLARYWPQTAALEWLFWLPVLAPLLSLGLWGRRALPRAVAVLARFYLGAAGLLVLALSILDMETMRFTGGHVTPSLMRTYNNVAAARTAVDIQRHDAGGPFSSLVVVALALSLWLARGRVGRPAWMPMRSAWKTAFIVLLGTALALHVGLRVHGSRFWRLSPVAAVFANEWIAQREEVMTPARLTELADAYHRVWYEGAGPQEARRWVFPDRDHPLYRTTAHDACVRGAGAALGLHCDRDEDADGATLTRDCDDGDPRAHPGAMDVPGDGVDQTCRGLDGDPWNVILVILESFRGAGVGHLRPWGAEVENATPFLDELAREGTAFTRVYANGIPSVASFMTIHTGIAPHPSRVVGRDFTHVSLDALPRRLGEHGYATQFFCAGAPDLANLTFWSRRWYDGLVYPGWNAGDAVTFARAREWMTSQRPPGHPFFATLWTIVNHVPFDGLPVHGIVPSGLDLRERVPLTMRWTDDRLRDFVASIRNEPWFAHTILIVTGDHGFPLGEHGSALLGGDLYGESTWVPLVIVGDHPKLRAHRGVDDRVASHLDIAPTVFDLLGIADGTAFAGHSLMEPAGDPVALGLLWPEIAYARGDRRLFVSQPRATRPGGTEVFDTSHNRLDLVRVGDGPELGAMKDAAFAAAALQAWVYEHDRVRP